MSEVQSAESPGSGWPQWLAAAGGFVLGWILDWFTVAVAFVVSLSQPYDNAIVYVLIGGALIGVPLVFLLALSMPRFRYPFVIGVAAGTVVASGLCTTTFVAGGGGDEQA